MKKLLTRRQFLRSGALVAAGATIAACAPQAAPPAEPSSAEPTPADAAPEAEAPQASEPSAAAATQVRLSVWADVQDAAVYDNMVKAFQATQDNISVVTEQYAGDYYSKVMANFAGGDAADVLYYQGWKWQAFAEDKVLISLDDFVNADNLQAKWVDNDNYKNTTEWKGVKYMTPSDVGSLVIYYNRDLFDKRGVPYPKEGWTWEDFQAYIEKLSFEEDGIQYYGWAQGAGWNGAYARVVNFMRRNGYVEWDQIVEPTKALWDHPDVISALQFCVYDTIAKGWSPSPEVIQGGGVGVDTGRVAMVLEGPWFMPRLWGDLSTLAKETGGINYDVAEPPIGTVDLNFNFGHVHGHCITATSKQQAAGWELIKFILADEGQQIIAQGGRMCGHPDNIDKIWAPLASETYNFKNTAAFSNGMREGATPVILGQGSTFDVYGGGPLQVLWDKLVGLQATAAEAVPAANQELQTALDEYWAARS